MDTLEYDIHTGALTRAGTLQSHEASGCVFRATFERGRMELHSVEDAGDGFGFEQGELARTRVSVSQQGGGVRVEVAARAGAFEPHPRAVVLEVYSAQAPTRVTLDGQEVQADWREGAVRVRYQDDGKGRSLGLL